MARVCVLCFRVGNPRSLSGQSWVTHVHTGPQVDEEPERVLIAGWGHHAFMADLLRELDHGSAALPPGSEVVLVNAHEAGDSLAGVLHGLSLDNVAVCLGGGMGGGMGGGDGHVWVGGWVGRVGGWASVGV
jgi:hypothetical protein